MKPIHLWLQVCFFIGQHWPASKWWEWGGSNPSSYGSSSPHRKVWSSFYFFVCFLFPKHYAHRPSRWCWVLSRYKIWSNRCDGHSFPLALSCTKERGALTITGPGIRRGLPVFLPFLQGCVWHPLDPNSAIRMFWWKSEIDPSMY